MLLLVCTIFVALRLPSLIEPHWYGDEGIYQVVGRALAEGRVLYRDIWDNKPPVLYIIYAFSYGNLFIVKLLSLIAGLGSTVVLYKLAKKLFRRTISVFVTISLFSILFGSPILEGNIANAENFMLLPVIASAYLIIIYQKNSRLSHLLLAGLFLSFSLMTKIVSVFDFATFLIFLLATNGLVISKDWKRISLFTLSFLSTFLIFIIYFLIAGTFVESMSSIFLQNISYVSEQNGSTNPLLFFISKILILIVVVFILIKKRKSISISNIFIYLWLAFSIYSAFFSARPYIHYLLVILPSFVLLVGQSLESKKNMLLNIVLIFTISFMAYFHFKVYRKNISYYENFIKVITNNKSITEYERFFDGSTPRDYSIANFIKLSVSSDETIFLWSDSPQIYVLANKLPIGKYIVAYHITFYKNADIITRDQLEKSQPKYIIQTVAEPLGKELISSYKLKYLMEGAKIYERKI